MKESTLWSDWAKPALIGWDPVRVETSASDGFPDVSHKNGEIELKVREDWPVKPMTPVTIKHYTTQQRLWHRKRWHAGGNVFVLLGVASDGVWMFDGLTAADHLGKVPRIRMEELSLGHWATKREFIKNLKKALISAAQNQ